MMYFQIYNHFDNDETNYTYKETNQMRDICIVCLENSDKKLSDSSFLYSENLKLEKICSCECFIHQTCLDPWLYKNESCPICRKKMNFCKDDTYFRVTYFQTFIERDNIIKVSIFIIRCIRSIFLLTYFSFIIICIFNVLRGTKVIIKMII